MIFGHGGLLLWKYCASVVIQVSFLKNQVKLLKLMHFDMVSVASKLRELIRN